MEVGYKTNLQTVLGRHQTTCPHSFITDYDSGEVVCTLCGIVSPTKLLSKGAEWRAYTGEERASRSRVGSPTSFAVHDKGLPTTIDLSNRDAKGRRLSADQRAEMYKLRKIQTRTVLNTSCGRNLSKAMAILDRTIDRLHLPNPVKEKAALVYRQALEAHVLRGRSIAEIMAASVYTACRLMDAPRSLKEIVESSGVKRHDLARSYRLLLKELSLQVPIQDPKRCLSKIASRSGVSMQTQLKAAEILDEARRKGVTAGKNPMGLAAASLYLACTLQGEKKSQEDLAEAADCTEVTVRYRYKGLKKALGL